jgi:hypothetical protein
MGITVTGDTSGLAEKNLLAAMLERFKTSSEGQSFLRHAAEAQEREAADARTSVLDELDHNHKEATELDKQIIKQQAAADKAHDAWVEQAAKLGEMQQRRQHLQSAESSACIRLNLAGNDPVETHMGFLESGIPSALHEVARMRDTPGITDSEKFKTRREVEKCRRYVEVLRSQIATTNDLRKSRLSPAKIAERIAELRAEADAALPVSMREPQ